MTSRQSGFSNRLAFIDLARSAAIGLALMVHVDIAFNLDVSLALTRLATPIFAFIFGVMLELVYARVAETRGMPEARAKLLRRAAMCYGVYILTVWIGFARGYSTATEAAWASIFSGQSLFNNILKFYAVALMLVLPLLSMRLKYGLFAPLLLGGAYWLATPLLDLAPWPADGTRLSYLTGLVFGRPSLGPAGLPLLPSCALIGAGMFLGASIRTGDLRRFLQASGAVIAGAVVIRLGHALWVMPASLSAGFFSMEGRGSFPYFLWGTTAAAAMLVACRALEPALRRLPRLTDALTLPGRYPLLAFGGGNILLNLWPDRFRVAAFSTWNVVLFVAALATMLVAADLIARGRRVETGRSLPQAIGG
jgi:hypothetical protein